MTKLNVTSLEVRCNTVIGIMCVSVRAVTSISTVVGIVTSDSIGTSLS